MNRRRWSILLLVASITLILVPWLHARIDGKPTALQPVSSALDRLPAHTRK